MVKVYRAIALLFFLILASPAFADANTPLETTIFGSSDFWQKFSVALIGVLLGFVGNYLLARRKESREPQKQLAYQQDVSQALGSRDAKLPDKLKILYDNKEAESLYLISIYLENSGNTVIKNQFVRFALPQDAKILDSYFDPIPQQEIGAKPDSSFTEIDNERRYFITHLESRQSLSFRLIASAKSTPSVQIYPFNEAGDVQLIAREIKVASDKRDNVVEFIRLFVFFTIVPPIVHLIPIALIANSASAAFRLVFVLLMLPHVTGFSRAVSEAILAVSSQKTVTSAVQRVAAEKIDVLEIKTESKG